MHTHDGRLLRSFWPVVDGDREVFRSFRAATRRAGELGAVAIDASVAWPPGDAVHAGWLRHGRWVLSDDVREVHPTIVRSPVCGQAWLTIDERHLPLPPGASPADSAADLSVLVATAFARTHPGVSLEVRLGPLPLGKVVAVGFDLDRAAYEGEDAYALQLVAMEDVREGVNEALADAMRTTSWHVGIATEPEADAPSAACRAPGCAVPGDHAEGERIARALAEELRRGDALDPSRPQ